MAPHKPRASDPVSLHWVDGDPPALAPTGSAFGLPWGQGEVDRTTPFAASADGSGIPIQSWPLAYWPNGSLKWTGHALAANTGLSSSITVTTETPTEPASPVSVEQDDSTITVTTGSFVAKFNKSGDTSIQSLALDGSEKAQNGQLIAHIQDAPDTGEDLGARPTVTALVGRIKEAGTEQEGPVRAVIKVSGEYSGDNHADFLPFTARFYVSAGATTVRLVHFFIYNGDQNKDFIKGLGLRFSVPLADDAWNRHVRFSTTEGGLWGESVVNLSGVRRDATAAVLTPQFIGQATPDISTWPTTVSSEVDQLAVWGDFMLDQLSSEHLEIRKRSSAGNQASWLHNAGFGRRAAGVGYVGGATAGGVVFGLRDFWEGAPRGLDIKNAHTDAGEVTLWAYSPRAPASDMRHYDTVAHGLDLAYEDVGDPDPNPIGIGRSYEVTLQVVSATPSRSDLAQWSSVLVKVPQLVATPVFYASHRLFGGRWNVPDTSAGGLIAQIEQRKSNLLDFYIAEIEQRQFYGFWNFGDVMHTYDQTRHTWRYDVGGYAWDNGELGTDLWLWMSFLRTGRADVWRIAHAMTRHLSEVDFHHIGPFAGLGSRHNVSHWGDGAKEARVASSTLKRPFYYLTTDELIGDLVDYSLQADQTVLTWEPLRKVLPPPPDGLGRLRIGPDWTALAGNWFMKWERTNDSHWLDRLQTSMKDIGNFQFGLFTGNASAVGYEADTGHLVDIGGSFESSYHLTMLFGGGEFLMEAVEIIPDIPDFDAAWIDFCRLYNGTAEQQIERYGQAFNNGGFEQLYVKLQAYAGERLNDNSIKQAAWDILSSDNTGTFGESFEDVGGTNVVNPIREIPDVNTNDCASRSLAEYAIIAIAPELAPNSLVPDSRPIEWEASTVAGSHTPEKQDYDARSTDLPHRHSKWLRWLCMT